MAQSKFSDWLEDELVRRFPNMLGPLQREFICKRVELVLRKNPDMLKELLDA